MNKKVFIAWNKDNIEIAKIVEKNLKKEEYSCIVGGGIGSTMFIENTVIAQMNQCDTAIIILEKKSINKNDYVFSENVMYEWGYLLAKLNDSQKIHPFIINAKHNELPSDILGTWKRVINKQYFSDKEEQNDEYKRIGKLISNQFLSDIDSEKSQNDKLIYLSDWDKNKYELINYDSYKILSEKLFYGIQASVYQNETKNLKKSLEQITTENIEFSSVINCSKAILDVFNKTNKLLNPVSKSTYGELIENISIEYESLIKDSDLKAWCKIIRNDKLELCYEIAAKSFPDKKMKYLEKAADKSNEVIGLIKKQIIANQNDENFANLFLAYQYRNLALIYCQLNEDKTDAELSKKENKYRRKTYEIRKKLRIYYLRTYGKNLFFNYLNQEYILSSMEYYAFVEDENEKENLFEETNLLIEKWQEEINYNNYLLDQIKDKIKTFKSESEEK